MYYKYLGKLPEETIKFFRTEIAKRKENFKHYQWVHFDNYLNQKYLEIFQHPDLVIRRHQETGIPIQKAFVSAPGHGYRIHKDGFTKEAALNVILSANEGDWVRWYDETHINSLSPINFGTPETLRGGGYSRDIDIPDYESVPYIAEYRPEIGDVYIIDTDTFHSFKCNGTKFRIVLQTKFEGFPDFDTLCNKLEHTSFINLIK
jgi:hypothetical protein